MTEEQIDDDKLTERLRTAWRQGSLYDTPISQLTRITGSVGAGAENRRGDNAKVQALLARSGHLDLKRTDGPTGYGLMTLENAIAGFQRDNDLEADGRIDPNGPTVKKLAKAARQRSGRIAVTAARRTPASKFALAPRPIRGAGTRLVSGQRFIQPPAPPPPKMAKIGRRRDAASAARSDLISFVGSQQIAQIRTPSRRPASGSVPAARLPVPVYRSRVFQKRATEWRNWQDAVRRLPGISTHEARAYEEIFAAEGGHEPNSATGAIAGILPQTLNDLRARGKLLNVSPKVSLSQIQRSKLPKVYRAYFDDALDTVGGHGALERLPDPEVASSFADTLFRHGATGGTRIVQRAINRVSPGRVAEDGMLGPKTFGAFRAMAADPAARRQLLDALADQRTFVVQASPNLAGEKVRFDHFRFQNSSGKSNP